MKIVLLPSALDDLSNGFDFYERQREGLGDYFLEALLSDIDSLRWDSHKGFSYYRPLSKRFPTRSITSLKKKPFGFRPCWIAAKIPRPFAAA